jgi:hypothetical protein
VRSWYPAAFAWITFVAEHRTLEIVNWTMIAGIAIAALLLFHRTGMTFAWRSAGVPAFAMIASLVLGGYYRLFRHDEALGSTLIAAAQVVAYTAAAMPLSYLTASLGGPLWDAALLSSDLSLGLDWRAYLGFVNAHPALGLGLTLAYQSLLPQLILAVAALGFTRREQEMGIFLGAAILSGIIVIVLSGAMPAMPVFTHLGLQPGDYSNLAPASGELHVPLLNALRSGTLRLISLDDAMGIIAFPSYHAALGVIFGVAFWSVPRLRWLALVLNAMLIAATPIDGGHYFVDVLAGVAVAAISLAAMHSLSSISVSRLREAPAVA